MEKKISVFIEDVAFIDKGPFRSMSLICVRPNGNRFELWMDLGQHTSRAHLANWRHVRQMLKLYGIDIENTASTGYDEKAQWAKILDKFYHLKIEVTKDGGKFLRRVEGRADPFKIIDANDADVIAACDAYLEGLH